MTLLHTISDEKLEKGNLVKSEDESEEENFDSNESVQDSESIKSEIESSNKESNDESGEENENSDNEENSKSNKGWADSISKILKTNKPKNKKTLVLSKAKKLTDVKKQKVKDPGFEIEGEIKEEKPDPLEALDQIKTDPDEPARKKKKELVSIRVKPDPTDRERERSLKRIATRGVVQLFNAVRSQQKDIDQRLEEAGPLEKNKEKALKSIDKRQFLDVLMGSENAKSEAIDNPVKEDKDKEKDSKKETGSTWNVLRDDFMLSAKYKDWDKQEESDENNELQDL